MRKAIEKDKENILNYLEAGLSDCVYPYIDIKNYGIVWDNMGVWLEENNCDIDLVAVKYYDSFWIYTHKKKGSLESIVSLLRQNPVSMISGRKDIIERLEPEFQDYRASYGVVYLMDQYRKIKRHENLFTASADHVKEIAELICSDEEIGGHYTVQGLSEQLRERIETGTGRSLCIREDNKIVAHSATYAEAEGVAVVGGTIIDSRYRDKNYYFLISNCILSELAEEKKAAYTFSLSEKMIRYHDTLHTRCGEYGKLEKNSIDTN